MKTRYTSLVKVKKNIMQKSERALEFANIKLHNAEAALETSYKELQDIQTPLQGKITAFLSARTLLDSQRALISHNQEWLEYANKDLLQAKKQLKIDMIEFEKFQYLEYQEREKEHKIRKQQEAKELDEIALITHARKEKIRFA